MLGAAADVLRSFGSGFGGQHLAIVGGIVPGLLVPDPPRGTAPHVGTADLDLHLSLQLMEGETADYYASIVEGLRSLDLAADDSDGRTRRWRWLGTHRGVALQVELLCPARGRPAAQEPPAAGTVAEINVGPTGQITALALGLGHLVTDDITVISRRVETSAGFLTYPFPVAGLTSWLCLKSEAIVGRNKAKDSYDVVWLLNALGPEQAAETVVGSPLLAGTHALEVQAVLGRLVGDQFLDTTSVGPQSYATFIGATAGPPQHRQAQATVAEFGRALAALGGAI